MSIEDRINKWLREDEGVEEAQDILEDCLIEMQRLREESRQKVDIFHKVTPTNTRAVKVQIKENK